MEQYNYSGVNGSDRWFQTTQWSEIRQLRQSDESLHQKLLESLFSRYWAPVFWYIRHRGYDHDSAKDLTQDFFHEIALGRNLFDRANEEKGKLRTFLLTAVKRYLATVKRKQSARKRNPNLIISIDRIDMPEPATKDTPEQAYVHSWAAELLDKTLEEVSNTHKNSTKKIQWLLFRDQILDPIMNNSSKPSLRQLCEKYSIETETQAYNMIVTVRRRFRSTLRKYLRESVDSEEGVDEEILEILRIFSKSSA